MGWREGGRQKQRLARIGVVRLAMVAKRAAREMRRRGGRVERGGTQEESRERGRREDEEKSSRGKNEGQGTTAATEQQHASDEWEKPTFLPGPTSLRYSGKSSESKGSKSSKSTQLAALRGRASD
ncbi:hypothetical protein F503_00799 [Ophiostoma piceae UAMH 11346]|uniref:Uncharacterized protein n=1 Tax=Ophiostoma piceae (strain UAMH 11346) TaxID=1262450 RepID=S3C7U1_OPHP1|nr:hypothetical protein F503_00799 [Ophiostoma piceae UAMH 11346]